MAKGIGIFCAGLLIGALSGGATALFSKAQVGNGHGANGHSRVEGLAAKGLDRDQEELGTWSGKVAMSRQVSRQALAGAPLGWY